MTSKCNLTFSSDRAAPSPAGSFLSFGLAVIFSSASNTGWYLGLCGHLSPSTTPSCCLSTTLSSHRPPRLPPGSLSQSRLTRLTPFAQTPTTGHNPNLFFRRLVHSTQILEGRNLGSFALVSLWLHGIPQALRGYEK